MRKNKILSLLLAVILLAGCASSKTEYTPRGSDESAQSETEKKSFTPKIMWSVPGTDGDTDGGSAAADEPWLKATIPDDPTASYVSIDPVILKEVPDESFNLINGDVPSFIATEKTNQCFKLFSELDDLGRCGTAMACFGPESLPTEERGAIGSVTPSGWQLTRYDDVIEDKYLYNRCHLLGYELSGENDNPLNLITGTRYMNVSLMLPLENMVTKYIRETGNHVLYRVTPVFLDNELVARAVHMEAISIEDCGEGICFNRLVYNIQPGIIIYYDDGDSMKELSLDLEQLPEDTQEAPTLQDSIDGAGDDSGDEQAAQDGIAALDGILNEDYTYTPPVGVTYIVNTNSMKFHRANCKSVQDMNPDNRMEWYGTRQELIDMGYEPCGRCYP